MLRLVAYAPDGVRRFAIHRDELVIGSQPGCDIYLPYTGVAQTHARLRYDGEALSIEDMGSRKGVTVSGRRVKGAALEVLDEVRLGSVTLLVEDAAAEMLRPAPALAPPPRPRRREPRISPEAMLEHLAEISAWVLADIESRTPLETLVSDLLEDFGGGALFLFHGEMSGELGSKFVSASDPAWLSAGEELLEQVRQHAAAVADGAAAAGGEGAPAATPEGDPRERDPLQHDGPERGLEARLGGEPSRLFYHAFEAVEKPYLLLVALPRLGEGSWAPGSSLRVLGDLLVLGLVHHVGWYEPIIPGRMAHKDLVLDPTLVVGESEAMRQAIEQLRLAADPEVTLLLRGEPGVGRERLARSLHLSSPRRQGPFLVATCAGTSPAVVEADLFGAEIAGKGGPVRRDGKLLLADGGTLFLEHIDKLPLELQDRLVRFLRSGEVEPAGSRTARKVDVRLVLAATGPLEPLVARDVFRVDLAYRLSQFAIDVPAVRQRREDLPLLIQSAINRCCHDTGKRMQGITVKAMSALLAYDYPGNLVELENIARQLVYLCPPGKPIDVNLLPEKVRLSTVQSGAQVDATSDLDLERLVADVERKAIREALRRSHGNKSQAARFLGLSRNGLAMKMERHGLKG